MVLSKVSSRPIRLDGVYSIGSIEAADPSTQSSLSTSWGHETENDVGAVDLGQIHIKWHRAQAQSVQESVAVLSVTETYFGASQIAFQSVSRQSAIPETEEPDLTSTRGFRSTKVEENGGNVARGIDATTEATRGNSTLSSLEIQLDPGVAIAGIDAANYFLPDNVAMKRRTHSHENVRYSSIRPFQFQSESNEDQVTPVSGTVSSLGVKMPNVWPLEQSSKVRHSTQDRSFEYNIPGPTLPTTAVGLPRRYMRDASKNACEKFEIGDGIKKEFYSPNYPQNYPPQIDCVKILEGEFSIDPLQRISSFFFFFMTSFRFFFIFFFIFTLFHLYYKLTRHLGDMC